MNINARLINLNINLIKIIISYLKISDETKFFFLAKKLRNASKITKNIYNLFIHFKNHNLLNFDSNVGPDHIKSSVITKIYENLSGKYYDNSKALVYSALILLIQWHSLKYDTNVILLENSFILELMNVLDNEQFVYELAKSNSHFIDFIDWSHIKYVQIKSIDQLVFLVDKKIDVIIELLDIIGQLYLYDVQVIYKYSTLFPNRIKTFNYTSISSNCIDLLKQVTEMNKKSLKSNPPIILNQQNWMMYPRYFDFIINNKDILLRINGDCLVLNLLKPLDLFGYQYKHRLSEIHLQILKYLPINSNIFEGMINLKKLELDMSISGSELMELTDWFGILDSLEILGIKNSKEISPTQESSIFNTVKNLTKLSRFEYIIGMEIERSIEIRNIIKTNKIIDPEIILILYKRRNINTVDIIFHMAMSAELNMIIDHLNIHHYAINVRTIICIGKLLLDLPVIELNLCRVEKLILEDTSNYRLFTKLLNISIISYPELRPEEASFLTFIKMKNIKGIIIVNKVTDLKALINSSDDIAMIKVTNQIFEYSQFEPAIDILKERKNLIYFETKVAYVDSSEHKRLINEDLPKGIKSATMIKHIFG